MLDAYVVGGVTAGPCAGLDSPLKA